MSPTSSEDYTKMNSDLHFKSGFYDTGLVAKIRRLKIQERQLLNFINKAISNNSNEGDWNTSLVNTFPSSNVKSLTNYTGQTYRELNNLYEDFKANINQQEKIAEIDIEDAKKEVIELEKKIKGFKLFIQSEIISLKDAEQKLLEEVNHNPNDVKNQKIGSKIKFQLYKDVIPSPVKFMMNTPLKSNEIQEFQDFIKKSHKYGWWDEYNHNVFVQCWKKYFSRRSDTSSNCYELKNIENSNTFKLFLQEVLLKISGPDEESVRSHCKWYMKYIYHKERQQKAITKWKEYKAKTKSNFLSKSNSLVTNDKYSKKERNNIPVPDSETINDNRENNMLQSQVDNGLEKFLVGRYLISRKFSAHQIGTTMETFSVNKKLDRPIFLTNASNAFESVKNFQSDHREHHPLDRTLVRLGKPTKQWQNRCDTINDSSANNHVKFNIQNIQKLSTPNWRRCLREQLI